MAFKIKETAKMALIVRKKSSYVFSSPSYIKKGGLLENKVRSIFSVCLAPVVGLVNSTS